jgi:protoporphyrinogen oxidase
MKENKRVAVIGAGAMGLAAAYDLLKEDNVSIDIYERDDRIGGMSASFDFDGLSIERYYHFVCAPDYTLFDMLKELGIYDKLKWRETKMGYYYDGKLYKWGNPFSLLFFPKANLLDKIRYGLHLFLSSKRKKWDDLERIQAKKWIIDAMGQRAYDIFWKSLFDLKFYEYVDNISAAWIWTRLKRVAVSRKNLFVERMGYIEGGSDTLLYKLLDEIKQKGGKLHLKTGVEQVIVNNNKISGIRIDGQDIAYDSVISTVPLPFVPRLIPDLPEKDMRKIKSIDNVGVVCVVLKLKKNLTENFWMNINDPRIQVPGMIEYSNLNPLKNNIVYIPFYLHVNHPKYKNSNEAFIKEVITYAKMVNPEFSEEWILAKTVSRYQYAQPVCPPGFLEMLPSIRSDIKGLYIADTSYYYPEDRSISESMRIGLEMAGLLKEDIK